MQRRRVGRTDIDVSALSLGSWHTYSRLSFEAGVRLVRHALDSGINFFDTAYYRDKPHTEVLFGRLLDVAGADRDDVVIAEKVWFFSYPEQSLAQQLDASLVRLGVDHADIVFCEHPRPGMQVAQLAEECAGLVSSGKARCWGGLNWGPDQLREAYAHNAARGLPTPQIVQLKYSLVRRNVVDGADYRAAFDETGATLHASDTMEGGMLAGRTAPERRIGLDIGDIREQIRNKVPDVVSAAAKLGVTPAQLAIAFCLANPVTTSVLFGATRDTQVDDNVAAVELAARRRDDVLELASGLGVDGHRIDPPYEHVRALTDEFVA